MAGAGGNHVYNYVRIDGCATGITVRYRYRSRHHVLHQDGDLPQSSTRLQLSIVALFSVVSFVPASIDFLHLALVFILAFSLLLEYQVFLLSILLLANTTIPLEYLIRNDCLLIDRLDALVLVAKSPNGDIHRLS